MMYATQADLIKRYGRHVILTIADDENTGELDETQIDAALTDAANAIDVYIGGRYALPLLSVPVALNLHACHLARYFLEKNRATDQARKDYEDTLRFLEQVAAGKITLGLAADDTTVESNNTAMMQSAGSVWARDKSKGFI